MTNGQIIKCQISKCWLFVQNLDQSNVISMCRSVVIFMDDNLCYRQHLPDHQDHCYDCCKDDHDHTTTYLNQWFLCRGLPALETCLPFLPGGLAMMISWTIIVMSHPQNHPHHHHHNHHHCLHQHHHHQQCLQNEVGGCVLCISHW